MTPEQREEIEKACREVEFYDSHLPRACEDEIRLLVQFARQQLNLRVDGEKLREEIWKRFTANIRQKHRKELESLVLECLTTTPEEKE